MQISSMMFTYHGQDIISFIVAHLIHRCNKSLLRLDITTSHYDFDYVLRLINSTLTSEFDYLFRLRLLISTNNWLLCIRLIRLSHAIGDAPVHAHYPCPAGWKLERSVDGAARKYSAAQAREALDRQVEAKRYKVVVLYYPPLCDSTCQSREATGNTIAVRG
nr:MAG: hypothetical protein [Cressdnaviricota sp.]